MVICILKQINSIFLLTLPVQFDSSMDNFTAGGRTGPSITEIGQARPDEVGVNSKREDDGRGILQGLTLLILTAAVS